jgi:hypothetical protein
MGNAMWRDVSDAEAATRDALIDQLHAHDVHYLGGGNGPAAGHATDARTIDVLVSALAQSGDARLRTALVALLFRHPEYAEAALRTGAAAKDTRVARWIAASILAAAALQRAWAFSLDLYLPGWQPIQADALVRRLRVPPPEDDYGRATLMALDRLLTDDNQTPPDYFSAWEDVGRHAIADLRQEAYPHATR